LSPFGALKRKENANIRKPVSKYTKLKYNIIKMLLMSSYLITYISKMCEKTAFFSTTIFNVFEGFSSRFSWRFSLKLRLRLRLRLRLKGG